MVPKTSIFINQLNPSNKIPNIKTAIQIYQQGKLKEFHTPQLVNNGAHFAFNIPEPRNKYITLLNSKDSMKMVNINPDDIKMSQLLSGEKFFYTDNVFPYSMAYAGSQFGKFVGQLGDGRALNLFELSESLQKDQNQILQIKGCGKSAFSREFDGKLMLDNGIKEFCLSEFLYKLGVPTVRSIKLTYLPDTKAIRNLQRVACCHLTRMSNSFIRVGNFEMYNWRPNLKSLIQLTDYCLKNLSEFKKIVYNDMNNENFIVTQDFFPDDNTTTFDEVKLSHFSEVPHDNEISKYHSFFRKVVNLNSEMVAYWQAYGIVNGMLNTDNTSIIGKSIDFDHMQVMTTFSRSFNPNKGDLMNRYCFENQPNIIWWNMIVLANSMLELIGSKQNELISDINEGTIARAQEWLQLCGFEYKFKFNIKYTYLMAKRLGINLDELNMPLNTPEDMKKASIICKEFQYTIIEPLLDIMEISKISYNEFFIKLQEHADEIYLKAEAGDTMTETHIHGIPIKLLKIFFTDEKIRVLQNNPEGSDPKLAISLEEIKNWLHAYSYLINDDHSYISRSYNPVFVPTREIIQDCTEEFKSKLPIVDTTLLEQLHSRCTSSH